MQAVFPFGLKEIKKNHPPFCGRKKAGEKEGDRMDDYLYEGLPPDIIERVKRMYRVKSERRRAEFQAKLLQELVEFEATLAGDQSPPAEISPLPGSH